MGEERLKILEMIQEGKITPAEGLELLKAIDETGEVGANTPNTPNTILKGNYENKFLRVRVTGDKIKKINVNIPLSLLKYGTKLITYGMSFVPNEAKLEMEKKGIDLTALDLDEIIRLVEEDSEGKLVDVELDDEEEGKMKVEVCVE